MADMADGQLEMLAAVWLGYGLIAALVLVAPWYRWGQVAIAGLLLVLVDTLSGTNVVPVFGHEPWHSWAGIVVTWADGNWGRLPTACVLVVLVDVFVLSAIPWGRGARGRKCPFDRVAPTPKGG